MIFFRRFLSHLLVICMPRRMLFSLSTDSSVIGPNNPQYTANHDLPKKKKKIIVEKIKRIFMITITIITFGFQFLKSKEQITNFLPFFFPLSSIFSETKQEGKTKRSLIEAEKSGS